MRAEPAVKPLEPCPFCDAQHDEAALRCPATDMMLPLEGRLLAGKFRLVTEIGRGGMGAVWLARNIHVDREVALKLLLPDVPKNPELVARFQDEARVAARIGHAGICDILDFEMTPLGPVIVMELLRGENLAQRIAREGALPAPVAVRIIRQALVALDAAHRAGIIHRDLKPENLFLHQPEGGPTVVKLMDFGISKIIDRVSARTQSGVIMGTPEYMAPEQVGGAANADARTDIWAIGAVLYKALAGSDPFVGGNVVAVLLAITAGDPAPIESHVRTLPPGLSTIVMRCLAKQPGERYQTARELADALEPYDEEAASVTGRQSVAFLPTVTSSASGRATVVAPALELGSPPAAAARSGGSRWVLGLGLLVAAACGAWWYATRGPGAEDPDVAEVVTWIRGDESTAAGAGAEAKPSDAKPNEAKPNEAKGDAKTAAPDGKGVAKAGPTEGKAATPERAAAPAELPDLGWIGDGLTRLASDLASELAAAPTETTDVAKEPAGEVTTPQPGGEAGGAAGADPAGAGAGAEPKPVEGVKPPEAGGAAPAGPSVIASGEYVTPATPGQPHNQRWAKEYCAALAKKKHLGVAGWKLANPREAKLFAKVPGIKAGGYWTSAAHKGLGLVVWLPRGNDSSVRATKKAARPMCVATKP